jgi:hypothetical protein
MRSSKPGSMRILPSWIGRYLIFKSESGGPREALLSAIDDYVEALTGDRRKLHDRGSSIG